MSGLSMEGYEIELATDGTDGLRRFADHPPDLVLLDVLLPGMAGTEVCRRMRDIAPVPGDHGERAQHRDRRRPGPGAGRGRLRHQAVPHARARGPHPGRAPPRVAAAGPGARSGPCPGVAPIRCSDRRTGPGRLRPAGGDHRWPARAPVTAGVRPARAAVVPTRAGAHPRRAHRPAVVGTGFGRHAHARHPRPPVAGQARAQPRPPPVPGDGAGGRLPLRRRRTGRVRARRGPEAPPQLAGASPRHMGRRGRSKRTSRCSPRSAAKT